MPKRRPPVISSSLAATGTVGTAFSYQITASNGPTSYTATGLPAGLTTNSTTGLISGKPAVGTAAVSPYGVIISARNQAGTGKGTLNLTVKPPAPPPVTTASAYVSWSQIANATGYKIFWGTGSKNYTYGVNAGNNLQCEVPNLTIGTTYYFSSQSYNATQTSPYGNEVAYKPA